MATSSSLSRATLIMFTRWHLVRTGNTLPPDQMITQLNFEMCQAESSSSLLRATLIEVLSTQATEKKNKSGRNKENNVAMKASCSKLSTTTALAECVLEMKAQLHAAMA